MTKRNRHLSLMAPSYLFPEVANRARTFLEHNPQAKLINLGIGNTTEPIPSFIGNEIAKRSVSLCTRIGYCGYGPEQGDLQLRMKIAKEFYADKVDADEIFISDGAKPDMGRLQLLFDPAATLAVQDPVYPVYVDSGLLSGKKILFLPCIPENNFFPASLQKADLYFLCSPNNPTGAVFSRGQMQALVAFALEQEAMIVLDIAYAGYIRDLEVPRSIYEFEGSKQVAIEVGSFSKWMGFGGVRLGWTVVPHQMRFQSGHSVHEDWKRLNTTLFNGASLLSQAGGMAALTPEGMEGMHNQISFYLDNARILRDALSPLRVFGGEHAPFIWAGFGKKKSWELFDAFLHKAHVITVPGSGFGPSGEGFLRFSAFGSRDSILEAAGRIKQCLLSKPPLI